MTLKEQYSSDIFKSVTVIDRVLRDKYDNPKLELRKLRDQLASHWKELQKE